MPADVARVVEQDLRRVELDDVGAIRIGDHAEAYLGGIGAIRRRLLDGDGRVAVLPTYFIRDDLRAGRFVRLMTRVRPRIDAFRLVWRAGHPRETELLALAGELRAIPLR